MPERMSFYGVVVGRLEGSKACKCSCELLAVKSSNSEFCFLAKVCYEREKLHLWESQLVAG